MIFYSDDICAAAYRKQQTPDEMRTHAVCDVDIKIGRLKRARLEALCNKKLNVCGNLQSVDRVDCPRCVEILKNLGVK